MGKSNYKLTDEQKKALDIYVKKFIRELEGTDDPLLYPYDGREFDNNRFTAMVWYVGEELSTY